MERILINLAFWSFQIINTITACLMTFIPKQFHESLFKNHEAVYEKLGFSAIAVEMVHNIIRGHGAVLLAVSIFIWIERMKSRSVYLLISIVCALSVYAHIMTLHQHLETAEIVNVIGNFGSMYISIIITSVVGILNLFVYLTWGKMALYVEKYANKAL
ncbi:MAG: hypothetical protein HGA96_06280 [Desulfobulbaceae bacterium]|nr:hypothetical protein [Desulfobulbaceae bacterium]